MTEALEKEQNTNGDGGEMHKALLPPEDAPLEAYMPGTGKKGGGSENSSTKNPADTKPGIFRRFTRRITLRKK